MVKKHSSFLREPRGMYSAILVAVLHGAAASPAQSWQGPIGRSGHARVYLVPRLVPHTSFLGEKPGLPVCKPDLVLLWNEALLQAIKADRTAPPLAARNMAMVHVAIYDAVNAVHPVCRPYGIVARPPAGTSAETA